VSRNFHEKRQISAVFLDVAKSFYSAWVDRLLYKTTDFIFPSYLVETISSYVHGRTFEASFQQSIHLLHAGWRGSGWNNFRILFSLYVRDIQAE